MSDWQNWARTVTATPRQYHQPKNESELEGLVEEAAAGGETVRVAGSGHSFSPVVPTDDTLISLQRHAGIVDIDRDAMQVTVKAGTTLSALNGELAEHGLALPNLGDIDRQSLAGAFSTGTHGTGLDFGVLATQIDGVRLLTADGSFQWIHSDDEGFPGAQVSLGALGVITAYKIDVVEAYDLRLRRRRLPLSSVLDNLDDFHDAHRNWEFFWFPHTDEAIVKTLDEVPAPDSPRASGGGGTIQSRLDAAGAAVENAAWEGICRVGTRFPRTAGPGARLASATLGEKTEVGPSHEVFANPRHVRFREMEYGVPIESVPTVLRRIRRVIDREGIPVQFPIECRFVGGDDPWLSPAHGRDSGFIAVHTYHQKALPEYFEACESIFTDHDGRPHWGKEHSKTAAYLAECYPAWDQFRELRERLDPQGVFCNDHLRELFAAE